MQKHLYFICPTDHLETVIDNTFQQEHYYCTSLGNSITFDAEIVEPLKELLATKKIRNISFVLSDANSIVLDALGNHEFSKIAGLNIFYQEIARQMKRSKELWQLPDLQFSILSYFLNHKIRELRQRLQIALIDPVKIDGKIYSRKTKTFSDIYADLICREYFSLN